MNGINIYSWSAKNFCAVLIYYAINKLWSHNFVWFSELANFWITESGSSFNDKECFCKLAKIKNSALLSS